MDTRKGYDMIAPFQYGAQKFKLALLVILIALFLFAVNQFKQLHYFPIKKVRVYGINHLDERDIQQALLPLVNHNFFSINVSAIRDELLQMPWVADLNVRRVWPDQIEITIFEKGAIALWNNMRLLSDNGTLFSPDINTYPKGLPNLIGPEGKQIEMINYFNEINRLLIPLHVKIFSLELTSYAAWKVTLDNGVQLQVGYKDVLPRLQQFVRVYPKIVKNHSGVDVDYVDLRYPNGLAVRWKKSIHA